jgi:hypothetical protein
MLDACSQQIGAAPLASKLPVADTYHGVKVVDDYR